MLFWVKKQKKRKEKKREECLKNYLNFLDSKQRCLKKHLNIRRPTRRNETWDFLSFKPSSCTGPTRNNKIIPCGYMTTFRS